jgi:hypothetical protein
MWSQWAWTVVPTEKTRHIGRLAAPKPRGQHHSTQARPISTVESTAGCHLPDISTKTISGESIWSIQVAKSLKSHTICGGIGCIFWYCQRAWIARGWTSFNELDIDIPKYIIWYIYSIYIHMYVCIYIYPILICECWIPMFGCKFIGSDQCARLAPQSSLLTPAREWQVWQKALF